jgi:hypothetical protein
LLGAASTVGSEDADCSGAGAWSTAEASVPVAGAGASLGFLSDFLFFLINKKVPEKISTTATIKTIKAICCYPYFIYLKLYNVYLIDAIRLFFIWLVIYLEIMYFSI